MRSRWLMQRKKRRLAAARGAQQHEGLLRIDLEADALEDLQPAERLPHLLGFDHGRAVRRHLDPPPSFAPGASWPASRPPPLSLSPKPLLKYASKIVLADGEHRGEEDVPDAGHEKQRDDLEVLRVDDLRRWS